MGNTKVKKEKKSSVAMYLFDHVRGMGGPIDDTVDKGVDDTESNGVEGADDELENISLFLFLGRCRGR